MRNKLIVLIIFLSYLITNGQSNNEFKKMDFLVGEWQFNAKSMLPDGKFQNQIFYSSVNKIFGGNAHKDNFQYKDANGKLVSYGFTIRTYDKNSKQSKMLWFNHDLSFITEMKGEYKDGEFHFTGKGNDNRGSYIEKITFYDITDNAYSWKSDKSYDGGETWLENFFSYTAKRLKKQ